MARTVELLVRCALAAALLSPALRADAFSFGQTLTGGGVGSEGAWSVCVADLDGDGDQDVLAGLFFSLFASTSPLPSIAPGLVALDLGAGFTQLVFLGSRTIEAKGWTELAFGLPPQTAVVPVYLQAAVLDAASGTLPAETTNLVLCFLGPG